MDLIRDGRQHRHLPRSPRHRYGDGADLAGLDLATLVDLRTEVLRVADSTERGVPASVFLGPRRAGARPCSSTRAGTATSARRPTSRSALPGTDAVDHLIEQGAVLVGIDSLNIDDTESGGERPAHTRLLAAGIHVVEHLTQLERLPPAARASPRPRRLSEGFGTFPVRAFAILG